MRPLPTLVAMLAVWPAFAQEGPFTVVSSSPAPGDSSVALHATVRFTFSAPLDTTHRFSNSLPVAFFAPPVAPDSIYYSDDLTSIYLDVTHEAGADYVWILTGTAGPDHTSMCPPFVLSYTTASRTGNGELSGYVALYVPTKRQWCALPAAPVLLDRVPGPGARPIAAATPYRVDDPYTQYFYHMPDVRPGTYWPAMILDRDGDGEIEGGWGEPWSNWFEMMVQDVDADGTPDTVAVADTSRIRLTFEGRGIGGAAEGNAELPGTAHLLPNYPNPFNPATTLAFDLERPARLRLTVYDVLGREVARVADGYFTTGLHEVTWGAHALPGGVYVARLSGDTFVLTRKLLLAK